MRPTTFLFNGLACVALYWLNGCAGGMSSNAVVEEMKAEASTLVAPADVTSHAMSAHSMSVSPQDRRAAMAQSFYSAP